MHADTVYPFIPFVESRSAGSVVMPSGGRQAAAVGVDRLQPGDHAFLAFSDDEERWDILTIFTQQGFARGEKVLLLVDAAYSPAEVAERVMGGTATAHQATGRGQLVVSGTPHFPPGGFDAGQLVNAARRAADDVLRKGYSGLRSATEMPGRLAIGESLDQAVAYETALHEALFGADRDRRYTSLCQWDERAFGGTPVMDAMRAIHPVTVLDRDGTLHVTAIATGIRLTGDSDLSTRAEFGAALRMLASQPLDTLVLDIADLSFLDACSAGAVLRLAAELIPPRRLEVRCRSHHRRMLHVLGGRSIRQLSIITAAL